MGILYYFLLASCSGSFMRVPISVVPRELVAHHRGALGMRPASEISMRNLDGMQFYGRVTMGTPPQPVSMVFDTGSGQLVVRASDCHNCQHGNDNGYDPKLSTSAVLIDGRHFSTTYGSGTVSGSTIRDVVGLGGFKANVQLAVAHRETAAFSGFKFDGIFGLSLTKEPHHSIDVFSTFIEQNPTMRPCFAIYLSRTSNEHGSELTVGGVDNSKAQPGAQWMWSDVVPFPAASYNYWAVQLTSFAIASRGSAGVQLCGGRSCVAIVDSGTTFISVAANKYEEVMRLLTKGKSCTAGASAALSYSCEAAQYSDFPTLSFSFGSGTAFELVPKDYVSCTGAQCSIRIVKHVSKMEIWIFGDFFMRKYYTVFDHAKGKKQMGFVCAIGMCGPGSDRGHRAVVIDAAEESIATMTQQHMAEMLASTAAMLAVSVAVLSVLVQTRRCRRREAILQSGL